jgi:2-(1,2-epoxy-1,2-dihydrophenyl)acetyl-CoA isomerase
MYFMPVFSRPFIADADRGLLAVFALSVRLCVVGPFPDAVSFRNTSKSTSLLISQIGGGPMERMSLEFAGKVAVLKFNHPQVMNAVGRQMLADFSEALGEIKNPSNGARCLLLTGEGRGFCAGANLQDDDTSERRGGAGDGLRGTYHPILLSLRDLEMPMVTAVNGAAAGVGMSFAIMGDIVCASKAAFFLQAFARIGLIPDGGSTYMLPRLVGWGRAMELSMLAERLPAEQAHEWGLVNRVYDDTDALMDGAMGIAKRLADGPKSLALIRQAYWNTWHNAFEQQLDLEARLQNQAGSSEDFGEGVSAFLEKRDARFKGQ